MDKDIKQDNEQRREDQKQEEQKKNTSNQNSNQSEPLKKEDLPDSTNESMGATGSGQRQDSN